MTSHEPHDRTQSGLWTVAYRRYYRLWVNLALTAYANPQEAEDVVHAVVQSAMSRTGDPFSSLEHIRNYVAKSVLNRAVQSRQRDERMVRWNWKAEVLSGVPPSSQEVEEREQELALRRILVGLNGRDWEIVKLRYFNGFTLLAIATHLGLAISTVKSREDAVLKRIRKRLRKNGIDTLVMGGGDHQP